MRELDVLLPPVSTPISRMIAIGLSRRRWIQPSVRVWGRRHVIERPVCTPIGSRFSMLQMITTLSSRSRITSARTPFQRSARRSIRIWLTGLASLSRSWKKAWNFFGVVGDAAPSAEGEGAG